MHTYNIISSRYLFTITSDAATPQAALNALPSVVVDGVVFLKLTEDGLPAIVAARDVLAVLEVAA